MKKIKNDRSEGQHEKNLSQVQQLNKLDKYRLSSPRKIVNLEFENEYKITNGQKYEYKIHQESATMAQTCYLSHSFRKRNSYKRQLATRGRYSAFSERFGEDGHQFASAEFPQKKEKKSKLPQLERQRYKQLLNAISASNNGNRLAELKFRTIYEANSEQKQMRNPFLSRLDKLKKQQLTHRSNEEKQKQKQNEKIKEQTKKVSIAEENIIKVNFITLDPSKHLFQTENLYQYNSMGNDRQNLFQKVFKNKQKLNNRYWNRDKKQIQQTYEQINSERHRNEKIKQLSFQQHKRYSRQIIGRKLTFRFKQK